MSTEQSRGKAALSYLEEPSPVLALTLDGEFRILSANALAEEVLPSPLVGRSLVELVLDFGGAIDLRRLAPITETAHMLSLTTSSSLPESFRFRFFPIEEGWLALGSLDMAEEIRLRSQVLALNHELNNSTRQLHQANRDLIQLNVLKDQFLGMAAHDLRKPVGNLLAYNQFVLDEAELNPEHRKFLEISLRAAAEMRSLIDSFLDLAIIRSGHLHLKAEMTAATGLIAEAMAMSRLLAERKTIKLEVELDDPELKVYADTAKVQQVLLNLLANAIEHSRSGQRIWLSVRHDRHDAIFTVRDQGDGIAAEEQAALFDAFSQSSTCKTAGERSIGLGLAIARKIVEAHHGKIGVSSKRGEGAAFYFTLPLMAPKSRRRHSVADVIGRDAPQVHLY